MRAVVNFLCFQVGWFACVWGAAAGYLYLGPGLVLVFALAQLDWSHRWRADATFLLLVAFAGTFYDSLGVVLGAFSFPEFMLTPWYYPLWMSALWVNFATLFGQSLAWMHERYRTAAILGALGGPLSYWAGAGIGAIELIDVKYSLSIVALMWLLATPALLALHKVLRERLGSAQQAVSQVSA